MMGPRLALALAAALLTTPLPLATKCVAEDYPSRPIKIIVPFVAVCPADTTARLPGNNLQPRLGTPSVLAARPGRR